MYLNDWHNYDSTKLESAFGVARGAFQNLHILLASYSATEHSGYAFVVFMDSRNYLFEVNASHDSVLDFNSQWLPEQTSIAELLFRMQKGTLGQDDTGHNLFANELKQILLSIQQTLSPLQ